MEDISTEDDKYIFQFSTTASMPAYWSPAQAMHERGDIHPDASVFVYCKQDLCSLYMLKSDLEQFYSTYSQRFLSPDYFEGFVEKYYKERRSWEEWIRSIEVKSYASLNNEELLKDHRDFTSYYRDSIAYFGTTGPRFTHALEAKLEDILAKHFPDSWAEKMGVLITPVESDEIIEEESDLLKIYATPDHSRETTYLSHLSKHPWLAFDITDDGKAIGIMRNRLENTDREALAEEVGAHMANKKKLSDTQELLYSRLEMDAPIVRYYSHILQWQAKERMSIKSFWSGAVFLSRNMWKRMSVLLDIPVEDILKYISPVEIQTMLSDGNTRARITDKIPERKKSYAIFHIKGQALAVVEGSAADMLYTTYVAESGDSETAIIRGRVASTGIYTGKVRKVVAGDSDALNVAMQDFQQGEVLVSSMTQPNMMVIAKKAGAIITDEGGITSHAAIISRELRVPCVVGCLNAMQILRDGDLVSVDANKGFIKIISVNES